MSAFSFSNPPMASPKTSLKLLVNKQSQRVLFAEATKEFIDFLFHIFSLPLGTLIELLGSKQIVGCLGKLKDSVESFEETYLQPGIKKDDIFNPKTPYNRNAFLFSNAPSAFQSAFPKPICRCSSASGYTSVSDGNAFSLTHDNPFSGGSPFLTPGGAREKAADDLEKEVSGSYVKELVKYMVMDDLVVKPMSTISSVITIVNNLGVNDLSQLEEKNVSFGKDEGLKLLQASLTNENVLTTVFLQK